MVDLFSEIVKGFKKFLFRDISYFLGGFFVILSFLIYKNQKKLLFKFLLGNELPWYTICLAAFFCYLCGYAIQEVSSFFNFTRTKVGFLQNDWHFDFYSLFMKTIPKHFSNEIEFKKRYSQAKDWLEYSQFTTKKENFERTQSLKNLGTSLGPSFLLASIILLIDIFFIKPEFTVLIICLCIFVGFLIKFRKLVEFWPYLFFGFIFFSELASPSKRVILCLSFLGLGVVFWMIGWIKVIQQSEDLLEWFDNFLANAEKMKNEKTRRIEEMNDFEKKGVISQKIHDEKVKEILSSEPIQLFE